MSIAKLIRGNLVAVVISPGYGAGWSTWTENSEQALFDPNVVKWIEAGKPESPALMTRWSEEYGYLAGLDDAVVRWLPTGTRFLVREYDGDESIQILEPTTGYVA